MTASSQYDLGRFVLASIAQALSNSVLLRCLATSLCCGVLGVVTSCYDPTLFFSLLYLLPHTCPLNHSPCNHSHSPMHPCHLPLHRSCPCLDAHPCYLTLSCASSRSCPLSLSASHLHALPYCYDSTPIFPLFSLM